MFVDSRRFLLIFVDNMTSSGTECGQTYVVKATVANGCQWLPKVANGCQRLPAGRPACGRPACGAEPEIDAKPFWSWGTTFLDVKVLIFLEVGDHFFGR